MQNRAKQETRGNKLDLCEMTIFFSFHKQFSEKTQLFMKSSKPFGQYLKKKNLHGSSDNCIDCKPLGQRLYIPIYLI